MIDPTAFIFGIWIENDNVYDSHYGLINLFIFFHKIITYLVSIALKLFLES